MGLEATTLNQTHTENGFSFEPCLEKRDFFQKQVKMTLFIIKK